MLNAAAHNWPESCENRTMDEAMSEPVRTPPFAPIRVAAVRALSAGPPQGRLHLGHRRLFLSRIMLGVATLIIVMAVMNGFRKELLDKILGLNGHLLVQPLEIAADRLEGRRRAHLAGLGYPAGGAGRGRPGTGVVAVQTPPASSFAASAPTTSTTLTSIAKNIKQGSLEGFDDGQGVAIGRRARRHAVAARRRHDHAGVAEGRGDPDGHHAADKTLPDRRRVRDRHVRI